MSDDTTKLRRYDISEDERFVSGCGHRHVMEEVANGPYYLASDGDALLAEKDAEIARSGQKLAALENYTSALLGRLTNGRISKPTGELATVEAAVDEAFTTELRAEIDALQPLAEIGRLAVARRKAQISKDNTPAGDLREVLPRRANLLDAGADLDDAIDAYLATEAEKEGK